MKYTLRYHLCNKECCYDEYHKASIADYGESVMWSYEYPRQDEHIMDWTLSKCGCKWCKEK